MRLLVTIVASLSLCGVADVVLAQGMSEAEKQAIIEVGNLGYLSLGATHMLSGYDHLMFVFGIIFSLSYRDTACCTAMGVFCVLLR